MMRRVLVVPAAGLGTRLGADRPKLLVPVRPVMLRVGWPGMPVLVTP